MKKYLIALFILMLCVSVAKAATYNLTLAWDHNIEPDLAGYRLYQSSVSGVYTTPTSTVQADSNQCTIQVDTTASVYFVVTAFDTSYNESGYSNEAVFVPDSVAPGAPSDLKIKNYIIINTF